MENAQVDQSVLIILATTHPRKNNVLLREPYRGVLQDWLADSLLSASFPSSGYHSYAALFQGPLIKHTVIQYFSYVLFDLRGRRLERGSREVEVSQANLP
jgi:hypothetical protein